LFSFSENTNQMTASVWVRDFQNDDINALALLCRELDYPTTFEEMTARMQQISLQPDYRTPVATDGIAIAGFTGAVKIYPWKKNGCFLLIQTLVVSQTYRKQGIGKMLIESVEKWGIEVGASSIVLTCGNKPGREAAHLFYTEMGFQSVSIGYMKPLI
jgi:GNAT superfamily N-acetyltransferase